MDDLVVNDELTATIIDDESTDATTSISESSTDPPEQVALGDDRKALLDITGLGHGNELSVIAEVKDAVGLVDRTQHGLDNNGG